MARPHRAAWLPPALLLLWVPGCLSLSGPSRVTGIVGGSLSVECQYREEFINNYKYWCKPPCVLLWKMMQTTESAREVRRDRMSIRDYPANLTFTVTLESLREEDAGTYWCGINVPLSIDPTFEVEVSVIPAPSASPTPRATRPTVTAKTSTITAKVSTVSFTTLATEGTTHSTSSQEEYEPTQNWGGSLSTGQEGAGRTPSPTQPTLSPHRIHVLLISLVLLLLLLGGISLLAWRMVQTRVKASPWGPVPPSSTSQAFSSEISLNIRLLDGRKENHFLFPICSSHIASGNHLLKL
ncbi:CMRF35-like molecule 8 isoform X3 [Moschus berezovskii]|uniref:CMRF35-like molecule 8 isoform X3 n=1 Tax=Moschus berezovskii TaxID=68408 RepID=UPI002444C66A|nr:CMRF35-like molecule 8 isoform X3 [Moschus berezovskii]